MESKFIDYQEPHEDILNLADVELAPVFKMNQKATRVVLLHRKMYKEVEELAKEELKLAGLRIDPIRNVGSRQTFYYNVSILNLETDEEFKVANINSPDKYFHFTWNYGQTKMAFLKLKAESTELWYLDIESKIAEKICTTDINANLGAPFIWLKDDTLLVNILPENRPKLKSNKKDIAHGPFISENEGNISENRTFQDLLKNEIDAFNFEIITKSELWTYKLNGEKKLFRAEANYDGIALSPDGTLLIISEILKPYSFIVPYDRFAYLTYVCDLEGIVITTIAESPVLEKLPQGFMATQKGRRSIRWRSDLPKSLIWVEALDEGDPKIEVPFRDEIFQQNYPFTHTPISIFKTRDRFAGIYFCNEELMLIYDRWWDTRMQRMILVNHTEKSHYVFNERNFQDVYNDPGSFVTKFSDYNTNVLFLDDDRNLYLVGEGYHESGKRPFVDKFQLYTKSISRIYQSDLTDKIEQIVFTPDVANGDIVSIIQSKSTYPNFYKKNIFNHSIKALSKFTNPFTSVQNAHKSVIEYEREDGIKLSATLYLPSDFNFESGEKLPLLMWAYPTEHKDNHTASQKTANENEFIYPFWGSPIFWLSRGFAILDEVAFPIIGTGNNHPNDTYTIQLVENAKAAINAVKALGYIDENKVAVGGHSYGAFMVSMLLTYSDLFAAGIARSGAYNRTLTPFGFQSEERNYWQAKETYNNMNPFIDADKMKTPLLLIHGEQDNNPGTHTMQSERYYAALKANGAIVRLCILPYESHSYAARESILHMLWEQDEWLEKYVKNRKI